MFIDLVKIRIKAGDGGNGAISFYREKYITAGGPDGGDGGKGGDVIFQVDDHLSTLLDFKYKRKYAAENGENGMGKRCSGKSGKDLIIKVPRGTLVKNAETGKIMADLSEDGQLCLAKGGKGGFGNQHFATPTRQAPRFAKNGMQGQAFELVLELKLLADVGLAGFPNVGKSTLLSMVSSARPKIANYHFTTLVPNLGVVGVGQEYSFVMADIPGLIEGASAGAGLGHYFLRHIDRCRLIVHLVDISQSEGRDPVSDFEIINRELESYNPQLASRPQLVVANKCDIVQDREQIDTFKAYVEEKGYAFYEISAATRQGVDQLVYAVAQKLNELPPVTVYQSDFEPEPEKTRRETNIYKQEDVYFVEGEWIYNLMGSINFDDYESRMYFEKVMRKGGVFDRLEEMGVQEGDLVSIYDFEFDYVK